MSRSKKYCYIQFQFEYKAEQNEEVYVVGNVEDLGNWDISKAEKLLVKMLKKEKREISYMLSELSGANTSLGGTIKINPFDVGSYGFLKAFQQHYDKIKANITQKKISFM